MKHIPLFVAWLAASACLSASPTPAPAPYGAIPSARQIKWAKETDLYSMMNFSTITYYDREWGSGDEDPKKFNPTLFDARQIVRVAKAAGIKGIVIDAKHHGGFCLWPSKFNDTYSVKNSPWKNGRGDIIKEMVEACRSEGLKVGIYLSPWDRNHKDYGKPEYVTYYRNQMRELLTNYGPLFEIWLDGANGGTGWYGGAGGNRSIDNRTYYGWDTTWKMIRELQPEACIFSDAGPDMRWNSNESGVNAPDCRATVTTDGWCPGHANLDHLLHGVRDGKSYVPAEADFPLLDKAWFWNPHTRTRTPAELVNLYFTSIGRNGTMDIGIAPDMRGLMSDKDAASLKGFGDRIKAIFATNLALGATIAASQTRGNDPQFAARNVQGGWAANRYWSTDDAVHVGALVMSFGKPTEFSIVSLREQIALGERVDEWSLDSWQNGEWKEFARGSCIGMRHLWRGDPITSEKIRLRITKAAACPAIAEFAAYLEPEAIRKECGVKTEHIVQAGLPTTDWKIVSASSEGSSATNAIDNNPGTFWHSHTAAGPQPCPQEIVVDMGRGHEVTGLLYTPRQDGCTIGNIAEYAFYLSDDGRTWGEPAAKGEYGNIKASPEQQVVMLAKPSSGRYFKFVALRSADGIPVAAAEIGVVGK